MQQGASLFSATAEAPDRGAVAGRDSGDDRSTVTKQRCEARLPCVFTDITHDGLPPGRAPEPARDQVPEEMQPDADEDADMEEDMEERTDGGRWRGGIATDCRDRNRR